MQIKLLPIPFNRSSELIEKLDKELRKEDKGNYLREQFEEFNRTYPNPQRELVQYSAIADASGYCYPKMSHSDLPEWFQNFLWRQYDKIQKELFHS